MVGRILDFWRNTVLPEGEPGGNATRTGFDPRTSFWLCVTTCCVLTPFAVAHIFFSGDPFMSTIVGALDLVAAAVAYQIHKDGSIRPGSILAASLVGNAVTFLAARHLGLTGVFWVYPLMIFNYSMVGTRAGNWINLCLCVAISSYGIPWATDAQWSRIVVTMVLTILFGYVFSSNIDRQKRALAELASVDPLTGARNRREMEWVLEQAASYHQRFSSPATLLILDLDHFKQVNDRYGHHTGDRVLVDLVKVINERLRATDVLFRYGGEEFLVLAAGTRLQEGVALARDLRDRVSSAVLGGLSHITLSVGVAEYVGPETSSDWLKRADEALYRAKANGRDRVELADSASAA